MPRYGKRSKKRMEGIDSRLRKVLDELIKIMDVTIIEGVRSAEKQQEYFIKGKSKIDGVTKKGQHQKGKAVDLAPYPIDWDDLHRFYYFSGFVLATAKVLKDLGEITHDIRWGGNWRGFEKGIIDFKKNTFNDLPHFELLP